MDFRTKVKLPADGLQISHADRLMSLGSCFSEQIGNRLTEAKFHCDVNPFGILYNPLSIAEALHLMLRGKPFDADSPELFATADGWWHSFMHHSQFSAPTKDECLRLINERLQPAIEALPQLDCLLITLGTAYVYFKTDRHAAPEDCYGVVANCHKLPESMFVRKLMTPADMSNALRLALDPLFKLNPKLQVLFTVSPIRHARDGFHANQLSKASLLLAVDALCQDYPGCHYFPSYEIQLDELRDYRFYADDMLHPSASAVNYIWECFCETYFTPKTRALISECRDIRQALEHRPFHPESPAYKSFLTQIVLRINRLTEKCPTLDFRKELKLCHTRLKQ